MLLIMYQIFSSLLGHLPFSVHFLLHFYGVTFFGTPNIMTNNILLIVYYCINVRLKISKSHNYLADA